jgi:hypothetical protein
VIVELHPEGDRGYLRMIDEGDGRLVARIFREAKTPE